MVQPKRQFVRLHIHHLTGEIIEDVTFRQVCGMMNPRGDEAGRLCMLDPNHAPELLSPGASPRNFGVWHRSGPSTWREDVEYAEGGTVG